MKRIDLNVPESWQQLTLNQLEFFCFLLKNKLSNQEIITRCFLQFSGLKLLSEDPILINNEKCYQFSKKGLGTFSISLDMFADALAKLEWITGDVTLFKNPERFGKFKG